MSIKGFIVNGSTQKYDYNELDNKPTIPSGGGVSDDLKEALLQLAEKIAYVDANGQDYYQDLYDALYGSTPVPTTYTVTNNLTHVTNSNSAISVSQGGSYTGTLTASSGYNINSVQITMGGNDVTGTSYSVGTITIANVTGNIVITAVATERTATLLSIDAVFTQGQTVIYTTDSLDTLKQYLVVTANWDNTTTSVVAAADYTLSGTLTAGTSTITASYGGKTDTFSVTVTHSTAAVLDTDHINKGQGNTFGSYSNKTDFCPTIKYELGTLSGTTYDYVKGIIPVDETASGTCRCWLYKQDDSGDAVSGYGAGKPIQVYSGSMTEGSIAITIANNYVALTIPCHVDYLDDSYLYVQSSGKVLFAGANTPYFGMSNVSEAGS